MDNEAPVQVVPDAQAPTEAVSVEAAAKLLSKARQPEPVKVEPEEIEELDAGADTGDTGEIDQDGDLEVDGEEPTPSQNPPPKSWSEADKELWAGLTPEVQQKLLTREKQREAGIQKQLSKAQQDQKAWNDQKTAEEAKLKTERQQLDVALQNTQAGIINRLKTEFPDVDPRDPASLAKLAGDDPGRKVLFDTLWQQLGHIGHQARQIENARQAEQQAEFQQFSAQRAQDLIELDADLSDPAKQQEFEISVVEGYLVKDLKIPPERINLYTAAELITARKAMLYDKAIKARKAREKAGQNGSVVVRGNQPREGGKSQKVTVLEKSAKKSGNVKDVLALYKAQRAG